MDEVFKKNVQWNIEQIGVQVGHAERVKARARSGYYKSAIILAAAVVEALAYKLLEQKSNLAMPLEDWKCVNSQFLNASFKSERGERLCICERIRPKFKLDNKTDFIKVNKICLDLKIFTRQFFDKIEKVRKLRNKIHIQCLSCLGRSYTKQELEFVSSIMDKLLAKI
jgi:hypothetical protein